MDIKEVRNQIKNINALDYHGDYEMAHAEEDQLLREFVIFVATLDNEYSLENEIACELLDYFKKADAPRFCA